MTKEIKKNTLPETSFTMEVKEEITAFYTTNHQDVFALLSSFIKINANLVLRNKKWILLIKTENLKTAKLIIQMLREKFNAETNVKISEKKRLKVGISNKIIEIELKSDVQKTLELLQVFSFETGFNILPDKNFLETPEQIRAYLAGAFLASGSVNSPLTSEYHLEMTTNKKEDAQFIDRLLKRFYLNSKIIKRRNLFVVYLKRSDQIADFLKIVSAYKSLMKYEEIRIQRDQYNSLNRVYNCDIANEIKAQANGLRQKKLLDHLNDKIGLDGLEDHLKAIAKLRMANPESSLNELTELYFIETGLKISKSGLNHRLQKLMELSKKMGGEVLD